MRLSTPMIIAFKHIIHEVNTLEKLARALQKSPNRTAEIVIDLETEGFVIKKKSFQTKDSRIVIEIAATAYSLRLRDLMIEYQSIKFEETFANSKLLFLAALSEDWMTLKAAAELSGVSYHMISRYKRKLQNRGILVKNKSLYKVNKKAWSLLHAFLLAYKNHACINGYVHWRFQEEVLFSVDREELAKGTLTGLYEYQNGGVWVGVISALCYFPAKKCLTTEEIFVHSLFEVDDPRTLHLAMTYYLKNNLQEKKVGPLAMRYGKYTMFRDFLTLFTTKEKYVKLDGLPTFDKKDFKRIAHMYEVKNV
jgi:hypothetical protein